MILKEQNGSLTKLDKNLQIENVMTDGIMWTSPLYSPYEINGFPWFSTDKTYRRLPIQPNVKIPEAVNHLANCTAGGQIRFQTDATKLLLRVKMKGRAYMSHMAAVGQCGFDCYFGTPGNQQFVNGGIFELLQDEYEVTIFEREENNIISITLNFPLYQGVELVEIGINHSASIIKPLPYNSSKKVIFYGTSITQGGCASRPGLAYTNILSRRINLEFMNLGFSGNGKGEAEMAELISEIENPACLVLDYEPNCVSTELYKQTLPKFITTYRMVHPYVPILVVSKFPYGKERLNNQLQVDRLERLAFQKELIAILQKQGDGNIFFLEGTDILGEYWDDCTADGVHPNDYGFMLIANKMEPIIKEILNYSTNAKG